MNVYLSDPQHEFVCTEEPHPLFVGGYGSGKSHAAICRAVALKLKYPKQTVGYYMPTYDLVRTIGFPRFTELIESLGVEYSLNKTDATITFGNFGQIIFRTMDTPERIIGYEVADSLVDELDTLPAEKARDVWIKIVARNRQKKRDGKPNTIGVATTPEGFRFVHEMWVRDPKPGYQVIRAPTSSNSANLPDGYIDSLRAIYPPELLQAYLDGEFVNMTSGSVYRDYDRDRCASREVIKPGEPLFIGQDFNVGEMASAIFVRRADGLHAVQELTGVYDTPELVQIITDRWHSAGHKIFIYPDASGNSRKTVDASQSDISILRKSGFMIRAAHSNPAVKDRILAVNGALSSGKVKVNALACPQTARCLEQQAYGRNGEPDKKSGHDHLNDAFGYTVAYEYPITRPVLRGHVSFGF